MLFVLNIKEKQKEDALSLFRQQESRARNCDQYSRIYDLIFAFATKISGGVANLRVMFWHRQITIKSLAIATLLHFFCQNKCIIKRLRVKVNKTKM